MLGTWIEILLLKIQCDVLKRAPQFIVKLPKFQIIKIDFVKLLSQSVKYCMTRDNPRASLVT